MFVEHINDNIDNNGTFALDLIYYRMSYIRSRIGESDADFDRQALKLAPGQEGVPLWKIYDPKRGGPHDPLRYLLSGAPRQRNLGNFGAAKEANDKIKREFHLRAEALHSNRNTMQPQVLFRQSVALKNEIAPYETWDGCSRFLGCPMNPYLSKTEITARIREADVTARNRMSDTERAVENMSFLTSETRATRTAGVEAAILKSEESRGKSMAQLIAEEAPQAIIDRAKEMAKGNLCTAEQVKIPILGRLTCPGGAGCGWECVYKKNKTAFIVGAVAFTAIALGVVLLPYANLASEAAKRLPGG